MCSCFGTIRTHHQELYCVKKIVFYLFTKGRQMLSYKSKKLTIVGSIKDKMILITEKNGYFQKNYTLEISYKQAQVVVYIIFN